MNAVCNLIKGYPLWVSQDPLRFLVQAQRRSCPLEVSICIPARPWLTVWAGPDLPPCQCSFPLLASLPTRPISHWEQEAADPSTGNRGCRLDLTHYFSFSLDNLVHYLCHEILSKNKSHPEAMPLNLQSPGRGAGGRSPSQNNLDTRQETEIWVQVPHYWHPWVLRKSE